MIHRKPADQAFVITKLDRRSFLRATGLTCTGFALGIYACKPDTAPSPDQTSGGELPKPPPPSYAEL